MDYDGNGFIGTNDVIIFLSNYGCQYDCEHDLDGDGIVGVRDLIFMLSNVGPCPSASGDFLSGIDSVDEKQPVGTPIVFDITGRVVTAPMSELSSGIYILKYENLTQKIFIQ